MIPCKLIYRTFAAAVVAAALPLSAAAQQTPPDTVRLRFGWAPGMQADVEYEQVRVRSVEGQRDSTRMKSSYRMEVDPHPEGLTVRYADMHWTEMPRMEGPVERDRGRRALPLAGGADRVLHQRQHLPAPRQPVSRGQRYEGTRAARR